MKSKLILTSTAQMSPEDWLRHRKQGIGASEVGTVLGLNPYKCTAQLFYEKLGEDLGYNIENMAMFMGHYQEDHIAELWQYWDGSEAGMISNYRSGQIQRKCQRVRAYVNNPDLPWLFVSLDRKINKTQPGTLVSNEGALELKTIAGYEANKWEAGIPPSHVVQVQTQLMVCEFEYGELAILKDGRTLDVIPFERNAEVCETIAARTKEFWGKVEEGRKLATIRYEAERNFNMKLVEECTQEIEALEPPPDDTEAYAKYLKQRYALAEPGEQAGTDEQLTWAEENSAVKEQIKALQRVELGTENKLKATLRDGADKLTFGPRGYVSWKTDARGSRRFLNKIRPE